MLDSLMGQNDELRTLQWKAARLLYRAGITADRATILGGIIGILAGVMFARGETAIGIVGLALSGGLDALDGTIAREFEAATRQGGILDLTLDRVVEVAVLLGLIRRHPSLQLGGLIVLATWYVNITVFMATGAAIGTGEKLIHYPPGLVERTEALVVFVLLAMLAPVGAYICYAYAGLEVATALQRLAYVWRNLKTSTRR